MKTTRQTSIRKKVLTLGMAMILVIYLPGRATAQGMPVYDNTNFITLGKQIIESAKQTSELLKTVEFLREQKERIEKVNDVIKQLKAVRDLTGNHQRLLHMVQQDLRNILASPQIQPEEAARMAASFEVLMDSSLEDLEFVEQLLSSDFLKMTDAERLLVLQDMEQRSRETVGEIQRKVKRYRDIIAFREMQQAVNQRQTQY